ncbi:MAG: hypothetical protein KGH56_02650 [Patescibacteria group bacterium]|nr:hypothetical protein [Patescibacteria group bacterium]
MRLIFKYDLQRDVDNFLKSAHAVNSRKPTKFQRLYEEKYGSPPEADKAASFIVEYLEMHSIDMSERLKKIEREWRAIELEILARMEKMFGMPYPADSITAYLSSNSRCTYNIGGGYFFVHSESHHPNGIIAHELLHFYTWAALHDELEQSGVTKEQYNNVKESLTELLNIEYADLLHGYHDDGYPQHSQMRAKLRELWSVTKDVRKTIMAALN